MARIVLGSTMIRYPLGGMNQWVLGWLRGFKQLGHDVYLVEKSGWADSCYDPSRLVMSDDCSYGATVVADLLARYGLEDNWCFVDAQDEYFGMSRRRVEEVFRSADVFVDLEWDEWLEEAAHADVRVFVDGEPGWFQMKMENSLRAGERLPSYDYYFTDGRNIGTARSPSPTAGQVWGHIFTPVLVSDFSSAPPAEKGAPFTTVMNWQSHKHLEFEGVVYGQKDVEFMKFLDLPQLTDVPLEAAISGKVPRDQLERHGWHILNADDVAVSVDSYRDYILGSRGEFSVAKNVFVEANVGWLGDRPGYYLAAGRPVVVQDTGISDHLPCGRGLFAVRTAEEAAGALNEIVGDYDRHSRWGRELAAEYLDAPKVLRAMLDDIGL